MHSHLDAQQLKNAVPFVAVLRGLGVEPARRGNRINCPFCDGDSKKTLSYDARRGLWCCFRCQESGDTYSLIEKINHCRFKEAMTWLADHAGVRLDNSVDRDKLARERVCREKALADAERLKEMERRVRLDLVRELHTYYAIADKAKARLQELWANGIRDLSDADAEWATLSACLDISRRLLAAHAVMAFSPIADRVAYISAGPCDREHIVNDVLNCGHVRCLGGGVLEVVHG